MAILEANRTSDKAAGQTALRDWVRALEATAPIAANPQRLLCDVIAEVAQTHGDAPALLAADERLTYRELVARANRYARWALAHGLAKGDTVCLMMPNRPDYLAIWLGLTSVGVVVALINTNIRGDALAHAIDLVAPKHVIAAAEFASELRAIAPRFTRRPRLWCHGGDAFERIDRVIARFSPEPLAPSERPAVTIADRALLIYTSGTTGLPKAANVSHQRLLQWSLWFAGLMNTGPQDRLYDCLPLYHSVGGIVATGALLVRGGAVFIREKFSAQAFWDDVVAADCTLVQYIGELCRYLLNAPPHPSERAHRVRLFCGNGLRGDVWEKFQKRFAIPRILEFYASTEGNISLYNVEGRVGAIGRVPPFLAHRFPLSLVKFDAATGAPARDENGFCIRCASGEVGEAIGKIRDATGRAGRDFEGYTSAAESEQKILRDVFERGDAWYRTGDLMRMDANGFFYFVDRIGDTFRWKGENVATTEVAAAILAFPGITGADVYGVLIPGTEGAAGMAVVTVDAPLDLAAFRRHLGRHLPAYARPLFVRVADAIAATATFKHQKVELVRQGYDPAATTDAIYFNDSESKSFVRVDASLHERLQSGKVRL
jgi:fatty-acyl-CoA synthase